MRLRACLALLCLMLAGCQHLPDGMVIDLTNRTVSVGPCTCALPIDPPPPAPAPAQGNQSADAPE